MSASKTEGKLQAPEQVLPCDVLVDRETLPHQIPGSSDCSASASIKPLLANTKSPGHGRGFLLREPSYIVGAKLGAKPQPFTRSSSAVRADISVYIDAA